MRASLAVESTMNGRRIRNSSMDAGTAAAGGVREASSDSGTFESACSSEALWRLRAIRRFVPMCYTQAKTTNQCSRQKGRMRQVTTLMDHPVGNTLYAIPVTEGPAAASFSLGCARGASPCRPSSQKADAFANINHINIEFAQRRLSLL